jgi:sugar lactone lactonase YvrE
VFVTGWSRHHSAPADYATVGYNSATGRQLWVRRYAGPGKFFDEATAIAVSPDGRIVFVTGTSGIYEPGSDYLTIAYIAATGRQLWLRRYDVPDGFAYAKALVVSPNGQTVFVTGYSGGAIYGSASYDAYTTVAYDGATGAQRWISRLPGKAGGNNQARNIASSPDSKTVYVTGRGYSPTSLYDDLTVAYNATTGTQLWAKRYNGPANGNDFANAVAVAPDGKFVYVTGGSRVGTSSDTPVHAATVAYNAVTGAQRWAARSRGSGMGGSLAVTPNGRSVIVAGPGIGIGPNAYSAVVYNAATGAAAWTRRVLELTCCSILSSQTLAVSPDSSTVYLTGAPAGNCCNYGTVAYAVATGTRLWQSNYNGPGKKYDKAIGLVLSPDGSTLYVTGQSDLKNSGGFATIAYRT